MTTSLLVFLAIIALYGYFHFFSKRTEPALAAANIPNKVSFENIVPTAGADNELELSYSPANEEFKPELIEDAETALLYEADKLLTEIETVVRENHDVYPKLQLIIPNYALFIGTDYQEMINRFIALACKEDCGIELSGEQLEALWS